MITCSVVACGKHYVQIVLLIVLKNGELYIGEKFVVCILSYLQQVTIMLTLRVLWAITVGQCQIQVFSYSEGFTLILKPFNAL